MEKKRKNRQKRIIAIVAAAGVGIIIFGIVLFTGNSSNRPAKEDHVEMTRLVTEYYEANIKGNVIGVNQQDVTLKALESASFDISRLKEKYDVNKSHSIVKIENPNEPDPSKIKYTIENDLVMKQS